MRPSPTDLFGEVPVTHQDVDAWLIAVPKIEPGTKRAEYYVQHWGVIDKIKRAKLDGTFDASIQQHAPSQFWWNRLRWSSSDRTPHS